MPLSEMCSSGTVRRHLYLHLPVHDGTGNVTGASSHSLARTGTFQVEFTAGHWQRTMVALALAGTTSSTQSWWHSLVELHPGGTQPEGSPVSHWHTAMRVGRSTTSSHGAQLFSWRLRVDLCQCQWARGVTARRTTTSKQLHWHTGDNLKPEVLPVHRDGELEQDSGRGSSALQA
jgi:hypothetical protein